MQIKCVSFSTKSTEEAFLDFVKLKTFIKKNLRASQTHHTVEKIKRVIFKIALFRHR